MKWWVTRGGQSPIGPVSTELLLEGIAEGMVTHDTLVCEVGGSAWKLIERVPPFSDVFDELSAERANAASTAFDDPNETTIADAPPVPETDGLSSPGGELLDLDERTLVDLAPLKPSTQPPRRK